MRPCLLLVLPLCLSSAIVQAQRANHEYRPEIIVTLPRWREIGVSVMIEQHLATADLRPNERIQGIALLAPLVHHAAFSLELRQVQNAGVTEHRWIPTLNLRAPLRSGFELRDRARAEIRDVGGAWSHRYQNRVTVGRPVETADGELFPYVSLDGSWDSRYGCVNRREALAGMRVPLGPHSGASIDPFVARQVDDRRATPVLVATGVILRVVL